MLEIESSKYINVVPLESSIRKPIKNDYTINRQNFRMKEFEEIDDDNYFLFLGCSNTFGIGLWDVEQTYSYKICKELNVECVNLGMAGASNDNILSLLKQILLYNKPPKHIIINWSGMSRRSYYLNDELLECRVFLDKLTFEPYLEFISDAKNLFTYFNKQKNSAERMCKNFNIPLTQISTFDRQKKFSSIRCYDKLDITECGHPGPLTNDKIANDFLSKYKSGEQQDEK